MSEDPAEYQTSHSEMGEFPNPGETSFPMNWKQALPCLVSSRIAIIQTEAKQAVGGAITKVIAAIFAAICLLVTWILIVAGLVGVIAANTHFKWYDAAFTVAGIHLLFAILLVLFIRSKPKESFPITRAEFEKDREWLNQLKNPSNSEN